MTVEGEVDFIAGERGMGRLAVYSGDEHRFLFGGIFRGIQFTLYEHIIYLDTIPTFLHSQRLSISKLRPARTTSLHHHHNNPLLIPLFPTPHQPFSLYT